MAQVTVEAKSNEVPAFTPLLDAVETVLGGLTGIVFTADALHTQTSHARQINERGGHLVIPVKGNQSTQLKALPWARIPAGHRHREAGHGRRETRTLKAVTVATPGGLSFPHAEQKGLGLNWGGAGQAAAQAVIEAGAHGRGRRSPGRSRLSSSR